MMKIKYQESLKEIAKNLSSCLKNVFYFQTSVVCVFMYVRAALFSYNSHYQ